MVAAVGIVSNLLGWGVMLLKVGRWTAASEAAVKHVATELHRHETLLAHKADADDLARVERTVGDARERWHTAIQNFSQQVTTMALGHAAIVPQIVGVEKRLANIENMLLQQGGDRRRDDKPS